MEKIFLMIKQSLILHKISTFSIMFFLLSFGGWILETLTFFLLYGEYYDRGFLTLPLCPIYGSTLLIIYFLCGTPNKGKGILVKINNKTTLGIFYFSAAFLFPTISEYAVGYYFDHYKNMMLWDYSHMKLNINGYVCLFYSLIWGILIFLFMKIAFLPLKKQIEKMPTDVGINISIISYIFIAADFLSKITI